MFEGNVDKDGVPLSGPMKDFVRQKMAEVSEAEYRKMITTGVLDPQGHKAKVNAAKALAIAEWNARQAGLNDA